MLEAIFVFIITALIIWFFFANPLGLELSEKGALYDEAKARGKLAALNGEDPDKAFAEFIEPTYRKLRKEREGRNRALLGILGIIGAVAFFGALVAIGWAIGSAYPLFGLICLARLIAR